MDDHPRSVQTDPGRRDLASSGMKPKLAEPRWPEKKPSDSYMKTTEPDQPLQKSNEQTIPPIVLNFTGRQDHHQQGEPGVRKPYSYSAQHYHCHCSVVGRSRPTPKSDLTIVPPRKSEVLAPLVAGAVDIGGGGNHFAILQPRSWDNFVKPDFPEICLFQRISEIVSLRAEYNVN